MPLGKILKLSFIIALTVTGLIYNQEKQKSVLILNSYHEGFKWTDDINQSIRNGFRQSGLNYNLYVEYMDTKRIFKNDYLDLLENLYTEKYSTNKPDIIICSDNDALDFLTSRNERIFTGIPVVFCGINNFEPAMLRGLTNITGISEDADIMTNIKLIEQIHPDVKTIIFIADITVTGQIVIKSFRNIMEANFPHLKYRVISSTSFGELFNNLKSLEKTEIPLLSVFFTDTLGNTMEFDDLAYYVSKNSERPVYALWNFHLGYGIAGGYLTDGTSMGNEAVKIAIEILKGRNAQDIPVVYNLPQKYMFDYNVLRQKQLTEIELPQGSIIINHPESFFEKNKQFIQITLGTILILSIIVIILGLSIIRINKAKRELKISEQKYRSVYENSELGIFRITLDGKLLMANYAFIKMLGYESFESIINLFKDAQAFIRPLDRADILKQITENKKIVGFETKIRKPDKNECFIRLNAILIDEPGSEKFIEGFTEDITSKSLTEIALRNARAEAEKSDELKSEFLAQVSHEIRTPINSILSFLGLIKEDLEGKLSSDLSNSINIIDNAGKRIVRTIDLILNMSQLQTGTFQTNFKLFNLSKEILETISLEYSILAQVRNLNFEYINNSDEPLVYADRYTTSQIFDNLLNNSIKFTNAGFIRIILERTDSGTLRVTIADSGIGISNEYLPHLFTPFTQEEQGYTRKYDGNGLGLALAKKYCELNDINITVESTKGKGTVFMLEFAAFTQNIEQTPNKINN